MNAPLRNPIKFDVQGLVKAIVDNDTSDGFRPQLSPAQWETLGSYLNPFAVNGGQVLIQQGAEDRTLYLVESGSLTVHYEDSKGRMRLAVINAGSAVGEGAFFSRNPRSATVQATSTINKIWSLPPLRFSELSKRQPEVALEIAMALGSLVSRRLANRPRRVAVT